MNLRPACCIPLLLLFASAFTTGCWNKDKYKKELAELDSMEQTLSGIVTSSSAIDSVQLNGRVAAIENDMKQMDTLLPDTVKDRELAILLMDYRSLINPLKQCPYKAAGLKSRISEAQKRIADLKNDLRKQLADEQQVPAYLEAERKNTASFVQSFGTLNEVKDMTLKKADSLSAFIKGKIQELEILKTEERKKKK